jgi:hypothetical protein
MKTIFCRKFRARFVRNVAGLATHVERGVTAAFLRDVQSLGVAREAEIIFLFSRSRLEQLVLVRRDVRIMAGQTIPHRRRMNIALDLGGVFIAVARQAELVGCRGDELDASDVFVDPHFVARRASQGDRRVHRFALRLVLVALQALGRIGVLVERHRVNRGGNLRCQGRQQEHSKSEPDPRARRRPPSGLLVLGYRVHGSSV